MMVKLQNKADVREFYEPYVTKNGAAYSVFMRSRKKDERAECGRYLDEPRANGVLYEMLLAYNRKERVFYMPQE